MENRVIFNNLADIGIGLMLFDGYECGFRIQTDEIVYVEKNTASKLRIGISPSLDFEEVCGDFGVFMPEGVKAEDPHLILDYQTDKNRDRSFNIVLRRMKEVGNTRNKTVDMKP